MDHDATYREALAAHHRRTQRIGAAIATVWLPLSLSWRLRRARATGDPWAWTAIALTVLTTGLGFVAGDRRAEGRADEEIARQARVHEQHRRARERGEPMSVRPGSVLPPGRTPAGCLAQLGLQLAAWVQAGWDYGHRPGRRATGPRWRLRPGPAWWTAWSFHGLPVNAASTAPRADQIAYERRQLATLRVAVAATAIGTWETWIRPGLADRDRLRVAVGAVKIATSVVVAVADHRLVPAKVDDQRARRRRHAEAVAELVAARAAGRPGPPNPWRADMLLTAGVAVAAGGGLVVQVRLARQRPKPPWSAA